MSVFCGKRRLLRCQRGESVGWRVGEARGGGENVWRVERHVRPPLYSLSCVTCLYGRSPKYLNIIDV